MTCIDQFQVIASAIPDILGQIQKATLNGKPFNTNTILPYHDNRLELIVPLEGAIEIKIVLTRTRAGKRIDYNPESILKFYRKASITIGPRGANRNYHVNTRYFKGDIIPLKCDLKTTKRIDDEHHAFPELEEATVNYAIKKALDSTPVANTSYPTSFIYQ